MTTTLTQPVHLGRYQSGTPEFDELRQTRIGGSEIAAVIGLHAYESHLSLWFRKRGWTPPQPDNQLMEWGRRLEPLVFDKFIDQHDEYRGNWIYNPGSYTHPNRDWQLASPDGIVEHDIVEVKTVQSELDWGQEGTDEIPIAYRCQALWNMDVMGAKRCWFPILIRGAFYREYLIEMDDQAEADLQILRDAGQKFIQSLIDDEPPSIDGHDATYRAIRERHPQIDDGDTTIPNQLADDFLNSVLNERKAKETKQRYAAQIMNMMGTTKTAVDEQGDKFAYRKPASNPDRTPFLMAHPGAIKNLQPPKTIGGVA